MTSSVISRHELGGKLGGVRIRQPQMTFIKLLIFSLIVPVFAAAADRPNIIVLLSDDMGWRQVGYNGGQDGVPTPNIDSLAADGIRLTQFYVQPVCMPTRGALMTGRYPWKTGAEVRPTATSRHGMLPDERNSCRGVARCGLPHLDGWQVASG